MKRLVEIFCSSRRAEMYLYVDRAKGFEDIPEALMQQFGEPRSIMLLMLEPGRKLARADAAEVLAQIEARGYYLQIPPTPEELLRREKAGD
ncbi:YcgL domain-containing protein [Haliea sp. E17]|uniref:YcgL domain-containing protein n=1 Tax=Haliea sp. E17 TaxID=3401576 RepID=UPI003AAD5C0A